MQTRTRFDKELDNLSTNLIHIGALTLGAVERAIQAIDTGDIEPAKVVLRQDSLLCQVKEDIDAQCLRLLMQQQPVATDLRRIGVAHRLAEGIDQLRYWAFLVAESMLSLGEAIPAHLKGVHIMASNVYNMVSDAITVYVEQRLELIEEIVHLRYNVENAFVTNQNALIAWIGENPDKVRPGMEILLVLKYLERMSYHAVNIANSAYILRSKAGP